MNGSYDPHNWRLFIDSGKGTLKAVLVLNGNSDSADLLNCLCKKSVPKTFLQLDRPNTLFIEKSSKCL